MRNKFAPDLMIKVWIMNLQKMDASTKTIDRLRIEKKRMMPNGLTPKELKFRLDL
ncbi:hypothetical protein SAMN05443549_10883 [Flavobacterium fluvii]|uniref:Uncharacterized protein n=1 Tax=Flavobacterium fluvii TaxID=468056 RepID=A0A1M5NLF2_9FLAO|nr:hypothetical protein [Flavobacterium fluvii]SHG90396.1 hypothetical protein SAMN05443549_10883 [Flavobacterium fluvii]